MSPGDKALYRRLLAYVRPQRRALLALLLGTVVYGLTEPLVPLILQPLIDGGFAQHGLATLRRMLLLLCLGYALRGLANFTADYAMSWLAQTVVSQLRREMFARLLRLPLETVQAQPAGALLSKFTYDVLQLMSAATDALAIVVRESVTIAALVLTLLYLDWRLCLLLFTVAPLLIFFIVFISRRLRAIAHRLQAEMGDLNQSLSEALRAGAIIRSHNAQAYEGERFDRRVQNLCAQQLQASRITALISPLVEMLIILTLSAIMLIAGAWAQQDGSALTVGRLISFIGAMALLFPPIKRLSKVSEPIQRGLAAMASVFGFLDQSEEEALQRVGSGTTEALPAAEWEKGAALPSAEGGALRFGEAEGSASGLDTAAAGFPDRSASVYLPEGGSASAQGTEGEALRFGEAEGSAPPICRGAIRLVGVELERHGRPLLADIHLELKPGETVALVGASGAGKSTLAAVIAGFMAPSRGQIYFDGRPAAAYSLAQRRAAIAYVPQETQLFAGTVAENIAYARPECFRNHQLRAEALPAVAAAAAAAQAEEFIRNLPAGYNQPLGDNGSPLSGGQRQRLAIARAFYKRAPILILDEATAALDNHSEQLLKRALETGRGMRTTLIIAHRLSTIRSADRIVVLSQGRIVEMGSHAELLARAGAYAALWEQAR